MYSMIGYEKCIYVTPCGYCSKFDKWCEYNKGKKCNEDDNNHSNNLSWRDKINNNEINNKYR